MPGDDAPLFGALPAGHRSGFVAIVGRPNVGKSTLLNALLGRKIAAVTPKPQTTRRRLLGIKTLDAAQILFVDTPGIHKARDVMNARMVDHAMASLADPDAILFMVDAAAGLKSGDREIAKLLPARPVLIGVNKIDRRERHELLPLIAELASWLPDRPVVPCSARSGENLDELLRAIVATLPEGPRYYPADELTDEPERAVAAELVREKAMLETRDEIPYEIAVSIDAFEEKPEKNLVVIKATLHVARDSQKPILVGHRGARVKAIGQAARRELEAFLGTRVFLELFVRVQEDWNKHAARLREFGI